MLRHPMLGCVITPTGDRGVPARMPWAADCGLPIARSSDPRDIDRYLSWLGSRPHPLEDCLFAVAPDVLGDAAATWRRSRPLLPRIRALGYRAALVAQDGFAPDAVAWDEFDVLFIGGKPLPDRAREWKRSEDGGYAAIREGKRRGKWVHVGRVNGGPFFRAVASLGADSADGSLLKHGPVKWWPLLLRWFDQHATQPTLWEAV